MHDRPTGTRTLGLAVGFVGVLMLAAGQVGFKPGTEGRMATWAVAACLLATLCYGLAASYTKKHLQGIAPLVTATGSQIGATLGLVLPAAVWAPAAWPSAQAWLALAAAGVVCTGVAYVLYFRLIERAGPAKALTVTFLIPFFAVVYGVFLLGERLRLDMVIWGAVVLAGTGLSSGVVQWRRQIKTSVSR